MKEVMRKSLLKDVGRAIIILEKGKGKDNPDLEKLKELSDHTIKDVALFKNLDAVSLAVLIYSIYKTLPCMSDENIKDLIAELKFSQKHLSAKNLSMYNQSVKVLFSIIKRCNSEIKTHIGDVFHAAKIKKGVTLLEHGLSSSRAAELMGISKWELLEYIGKTNTLDQHHEKVSVIKRFELAENIFTSNDQNKILFFDQIVCLLLKVI